MMSGFNVAQVGVFQAKISNDAGGEILGEHVADGNQTVEQCQTLWVRQVQRDAQLVAVLLVEIGPTIPELSMNFVLVDRVASIALQPPG